MLTKKEGTSKGIFRPQGSASKSYCQTNYFNLTAQNKHMVEFLIDENVLGVSRYLGAFKIKYRKVGVGSCPDLRSDDSTVAEFALKENLVILTNDDKLKKQCELYDVGCVVHDLTDLAKKTKKCADDKAGLNSE